MAFSWGGRRSATQRAIAEGYRSGLEEMNSARLIEAGVPFEYEQHKLYYEIPSRTTWYKPDFILANGIIVETKGRFVTADRTKHKHIQKQHPGLDIRFVFSNPNQKIGKRSKTSYAMWCNRMGIPYAAKSVPDEWLKEPLTKERKAALKEALPDWKPLK